jgi:hypothetical protein
MVDFIGVSEAISALVWSIVDIHSAGSKCFELQLRSLYDFLRPLLNWPICSQSPTSQGPHLCGGQLERQYEKYRESAA